MENKTPPTERAVWVGCAAVVGLVVALLLNGLSYAAESGSPPLRLIETGPGERAWLNPVEIAEISARRHASGRCGGFIDVTDHPHERKIFAVPLLDFESRPLAQGAAVRPLLNELSPEAIHASVEALSAFRNRYYDSETGEQATRWIADQFKKFAGGRTDIEVELVQHTDFRQPSVIARIKGTGAAGGEVSATDRVIIGAHLDSVNWRSAGAHEQRRAPGADDDASGMATVLEIFRVLAQSGYRPARTLEFMGYAGEELGLLGSQDIARRYRRDRIPVVAVLQFDMTMMPDASRRIQMIDDHVDAGLTRFTGRLIDEYVKVPWSAGSCGYGCSDHASWDKSGFASAFPFESPIEDSNSYIHSEQDTLSRLDAEFGLHFAKIGVAFTVELSQ